MIFGSLTSRIGSGILAIPAVRGIDFGSGFLSTKLRGSQNNDPFSIVDGKIVTSTNNAGGIIGGLSTGMPIFFTCAIKPTPTIGKTQQTINIETKSATEIAFQGMHDACIVPRAIPAIEAMTAIILVDTLIGNGHIPQVVEEK
jgi:chorismate synthase